MVYEAELTFQHAYVERSVADSVAAERAKEYLTDEVPLQVISSREEIPPERRNHRTLFIADSPAGMFKPCPGQNGHVCCNYLTVDLYAGCPLGCSYCIMKSYLASSPITVYADLRPAITGIREMALANPDRTVRVGTGEVGDSLLYDPIFRLSQELIRGVADLPNVRLELKTKTASVDHLLGIEEKGRTVIGFSLNPPEVVAKEEGIAASLEERLAAAHRVSEAGYGVAFHFDPIIRVEGWERLYRGVVDRLSAFDGRDVAWISLGTVRFTKALREKMEDRPYLYDEFFPSEDGKLRYLQRERVLVYRRMREWLADTVGAPVYLCMESRAVWNRAFASGPYALRELFLRPRALRNEERIDG